jgi:hypothetical protein
MRGTGVCVLVGALAGGVPAAAWSQAVCSAPHSGPVVASGGQVGMLPPGAGWAQLNAAHQRTTTFFDHERDSRPLILDGVATTTSLYVSGAVGLVRGLEFWAQVPLHILRYEDNGGSRDRSGIGDPRFSLRMGSALFGADAPFVLRAGVKLPGSTFPVDATVIPLTEGQRDWELSLESWRGLPGSLLYVLGWVGYRWREENGDAARRPGDELFGHVALGGPIGSRLHWDLGADVLRGAPPEQQGILLRGARRELVQLQPTLGLDAGPGRLGLSAQVPLRGRNLPASPGFSLGYLLMWDGP